MSPLTTHVLDTARGRPAAGLPVRLERQQGDGRWFELAVRATNADGRVPDLLPAAALVAGIYRLTFHTGAYFAGQGVAGFYPYAIVVFEVQDPDQHYHVPLLLSPFGYSTYRGS
jgi:5-hydroxyisourate hydrolase